MTYFRTPLSAAVVWAMIPLAAWAGMPSRACVCANGDVKLFCARGTLTATSHEHEHASPRGANCCGSGNVAEADSNDDLDCCGSGFCCHGSESNGAGIGTKACCKPILSAPSIAPRIASVPSDQLPAIVGTAPQVGDLLRPSLDADLAEINTGPPVDRVIVFRSLLI